MTRDEEKVLWEIANDIRMAANSAAKGIADYIPLANALTRIERLLEGKDAPHNAALLHCDHCETNQVSVWAVGLPLTALQCVNCKTTGFLRLVSDCAPED